jgi:hypothetical protein
MQLGETLTKTQLDSILFGIWVTPHSNFTGNFWCIYCQDLSDRSAWAV